MSDHLKYIKSQLQLLVSARRVQQSSVPAFNAFFSLMENYIHAATEENARVLYEQYNIISKHEEFKAVFDFAGSDAVEHFIKSLPSIYWDHKQGILERSSDMELNIVKARLKLKQEFAAGFIAELVQFKLNPLVEYVGGLCTGIALSLAYEILSSDAETVDFRTILDLQAATNMQYFEACHASTLIQSGIMGNTYVPPFNNSTDTKAQYKAATKNIVCDVDINWLTAYRASHKVSAEVRRVLEKAGSKANFAMELCYFGNHRDTPGHATAIVVKDNNYYFIDPNLGVYKSSDLDNFIAFLAWQNNEMKYCHLFGQFQIKNYPEMETQFPTPEAITLQNRQGVYLQVYNRASKTDSFRDIANQVYAGQAVLQDFVKSKIGLS